MDKDWYMWIYGQKTSNIPQNEYFPQFVISKIFFQKSGSVTFVPFGALTPCQKLMDDLRDIWKTKQRTNRETTDRNDYIGPLWIIRGPQKRLKSTRYRKEHVLVFNNVWYCAYGRKAPISLFTKPLKLTLSAFLQTFH